MAEAGRRRDARALGAPQVDPRAYDREYYVRGCIGAEEWRSSEGREPAPIYGGALHLAGFRAGERILDVGCGRGELVRVAAEAGAARAAGVDYSDAAIDLAGETLAAADGPLSVEIVTGDARSLPFGSGEFDLVTMLDVVEHLGPAELGPALSEALRVLRPGGRLFIHTAPNRLIYSVTYRSLRAMVFWRGWPREPRNDYELRMHVNEQRCGTLRRELKAAGFERCEVRLGGWIHDEFLPDAWARRLLRRLAEIPAARRLAVADLFALARRPPA